MLGSTPKPRLHRARDLSLGLAGLAAAAFLIPGAAHAADCTNGYRTLPNQVILQCDAAVSPAHGAYAFDRSGGNAPVLAAPAAPVAGVPHHRIAASRDDCQPGMYWGYDMVESGDMLLAC